MLNFLQQNIQHFWFQDVKEFDPKLVKNSMVEMVGSVMFRCDFDDLIQSYHFFKTLKKIGDEMDKVTQDAENLKLFKRYLFVFLLF